VFDKGMLRDGEGRDIDFKNCVIILTSNAGTDLITKLCADPETLPNPDALNEALHPELLKTFKPAFLGRITIVPYYPLDEKTIKKIVRLQLSRVVKRVAENYKAPMTYADEMVDTIASRCTEVASGARNIEQIIQRTLLPELSSTFLGALADGRVIHKVHVGVDKEGRFEYTIE
jgi:type VI secretion system protein VasG